MIAKAAPKQRNENDLLTSAFDQRRSAVSLVTIIEMTRLNL
jgi:hypothetical protein